MTHRQAQDWAEMVIPVLLGILIAGTGDWSESRWTLGLAVIGYGPAMRGRWMQGYWTPNPRLDAARAAEAARLSRLSTGSDEETQAGQASRQAAP